MMNALELTLPAWLLVRVLNVALASLVVFGIGLAVSGRRVWSLPFRHGILVAAVIVGLLVPMACLCLGDAGFARIPITQTTAPAASETEKRSDQAALTLVAKESADQTLEKRDEPIAARPSFDVTTISRPAPLESDAISVAPGTPAEKLGPEANWAWFAPSARLMGTVLTGAWLLGMLFGAIRALQGRWALARWSRTFYACPSPDVGRAAHLAMERTSLKSVPAVLESDVVPAPVTFGLFRPRIVIPCGLESELTFEQLCAVMRHEVAHIARRDLWIGVIQESARLVYWWNPLVSVASRRLTDLREQICDDIATFCLADRRDYAALLVDIAARCATRTRVPAAIGFGASPVRQLEERVRRILGSNTSNPVRLGRQAVLGLLGIAAAMTTAMLFAQVRLQSPDKKPADPGTPADAVANSADGLAVSGRVLLPDGSPAAGAIVWAACGDLSAGVALVHTNGQGQFHLRHEFGWGASLNARTEDGRLLVSLPIPQERARITCARPVELRLSPGRELVVSVSCQNRPVAGAHVVAVDLANFKAAVLTDRNGKARLWLPAGGRLDRVVAWNPASGASGKTFDGEVTGRVAGKILELSLAAASPHTIRVVDVQGRPVPDAQLAVSCHTGDWIMTRHIEPARVRTDSHGEALVPWMPRDAKYVNVDFVDPHWKLETLDWQKGRTVATVVRKYPVNGRLVMPSGANADGILVTGSGTGTISTKGMFRADVPRGRARRDGSFTLLAAPDHGYSLGLADTEWASDGWAGMILSDEKAAPAEVSLTAYEATPLAVHVIRGPKQTPVAGAWISLRNKRQFSWKDARGQHQIGGGGTESGLFTDENGTVLFAAGRGKHSVSVLSGKWMEERSVQITSSLPVSVDFDRPWSDKRTIAGRLMVNHQPHKRGPATIVRAWSTREPYRLSGEGVVQPDGRFTVGIDADDVHVFAVDAGQRLSGARHIRAADSTCDIDLAPMGTCSGVVVDAKGKPLGGRGVELVFREPHFVDFIVIQSTVCDDRGRFKFDAVPVQMPLALYTGEPASALAQALATRTNAFRIDAIERFKLERGEIRTDVKLHVEAREAEDQAATRGKAQPVSVDRELKQLTRDVRLAGMRLLVVLQGDCSQTVGNFADRVTDTNDLPDVLHYLTMTIIPERAETQAAIARLGWERPKPGEAELIVIDGNGEKIAAQRFVVAGHAAPVGPTALQQAAQFIKRSLPPRRDARAMLAAVRQEALDTGRRVWIIESGPRCGPCFVLARWIDDHHALVDKDYVVLKVGLDDHRRDVIDKLNPPSGAGIPWFAITEPDGTILATSTSPSGNIGHPSGVEGKRHFTSMLDRTARRLTVAERKQLVDSLPDD
jgi:beta-lactamase regulating signal transducer with metallopeptidase domain